MAFAASGSGVGGWRTFMSMVFGGARCCALRLGRLAVSIGTRGAGERSDVAAVSKLGATRSFAEGSERETTTGFRVFGTGGRTRCERGALLGGGRRRRRRGFSRGCLHRDEGARRQGPFLPGVEGWRDRGGVRLARSVSAVAVGLEKNRRLARRKSASGVGLGCRKTRAVSERRTVGDGVAG